MPAKNDPPDALESTQERIDDQDAALEESEEEREENTVVEEADANLRGVPSIQEFDLYINPHKPTLGLYVRAGAGLPDLADSKQWILIAPWPRTNYRRTLCKISKPMAMPFRSLTEAIATPSFGIS